MARYYRQVNGIKGKVLFNLLNEHMEKYYPNYNPVKWTITLETQVKKSNKYPLLKVDGVPITKNELDTIVSIHNIRLERLAFTILCLAKFNNLKNKHNNDWVNWNTKGIYSLSQITATVNKQCLLLNDLRRMGLIEYSKNIDNVNINVQYVDNNSDTVMFINNYKQLGLEYMIFKGYKYVRCQKCGILVKQKNNRLKYCKQCASKIKKEQDKQRMGNSRK